MADDRQTDTPVSTRGDRRADDRRRTDRRQTDRRFPVPVWRRPWALVSYGVLGALALFLLFGALLDDEPEESSGDVVAAAPAAPPVAPAVADVNGPEAAFDDAGYDRLVLAGAGASGRRVRTELFCETPKAVTLREVDRLEAPIASLRDAQGEVRGAECKWGRGGMGASRKEFMLLVPPQLAGAFSAQPIVRDNFVRRRRIQGEVEWIGRSRALSLKTAGVLRSVQP